MNNVFLRRFEAHVLSLKNSWLLEGRNHHGRRLINSFKRETFFSTNSVSNLVVLVKREQVLQALLAVAFRRQ